jgi:L-asparaginase II
MSPLARTVRSELVESTFDGAAIALDGSGRVLASWGNPDEPFFYRSAIKPIQATVAQECGASLNPEQLAVASASHGGFPIHISIVRSMLAEVGLDESALLTPPSWPLGQAARDGVMAAGHCHPRPIYHNCSGKHAGWLRACVAAGWSIDSYLAPEHPLQQRVLAAVAEVAAADPALASTSHVGVDGCGAPTPRGTARELARAFSRLTIASRYADVANALHRFPSLAADNHRPDGRLGAWWDGPLKVGAQGLIGAGRHGIGLAVKSRSGDRAASVIALIAMARRLGLLSDAARRALADVATPPVLGGGRKVGATQPALDD